MKGFLWWGAGISFALALIGDGKAAIGYTVYCVTVFGVTFLGVKFTEQLNKTFSQIIMATGICFMGVKGVSLVKLAIAGLDKIKDFLGVEYAGNKTIWERLFW